MSGAVFQRPNLGAGLEQLGQGAETLADSLARQKAQSDVAKSAVTLDANGVPQMATPDNSIILGQAGQDYQQAWMAGQRAALNSHVSDQMEAIRQAHEGDPQGFKQAADTYATNLRTTSYGPAVGNALADQAQNEATQHFANMTEKLFQIGTQQALGNIQTNIADTQNKMRVIARQGGIDGPEYAGLQAKLDQNYEALKSNKLFGYAPDRADSEYRAALSTNQAEAVIGQVDSTFKRTGGDGGRAGAQKLLDDKILNNSDLNLSDPERKQLYAYGMAHLSYLTSDQKAQIDANRGNVDKLIQAFDAHRAVDPSVVNQAITQASSLGDAESVMKIQAYAAQATKAAPFAGQTDEQRLLAMTGHGGASEPGASGRGLINAPYMRPVDQPTSSGLSPQNLYSYLLGKGATKNEALLLTGAAGSEGVYNPQAIHDGGIGYGLFGHNGARLDAMRQSAGSFTPSWQQQADFALKELRGRPEGAAANAATSADQLTDAQMAYEQPRAYTTGNPRAGENYTGRLNTVRFLGANLKDAPSLAAGGSGFSPSRSAPAPTPAQMQANPFTMAAYLDYLQSGGKAEVATAKNVGESLSTAFSLGQTPSPVTVAAFNQMVELHPDQLGEIGQKVKTEQAGAGMAAGTLSAPAAQSAAFQQQVDTLQHAPGAPLMVLASADAAQKIIAKGAETLKRDPYGEAVNRGWISRPPAPIDLSQPQGIPQAIAERAQAAQAVSSFTGAVQPMFAPAELAPLKTIMTSGTIDQRTALAAAIGGSGAPGPIQQATLKQLAGDRDTLPLAVAGNLFRDSPEAARGVIQGQAILQAEPKYAPKAEAMTAEVASAISHIDLPDPRAREGIGQAARAMYAKLSADAGDATGVINTDRMSSAIAAVTGGIRSYRGSSFVAPWYGATQEQVDATVRSLGEADFKGAQTADGKLFPASALKPSFGDAFTWNNWRLQSAGDGKYMVFSGGDQARQYLGDGKGGKFVLDLGSKRQGVERGSAALALPSSAMFSPSTLDDDAMR